MYKYTNNTYSHTANGTTIAYNTDTDLLFDLDWITNVDDIVENATYYFEIPVIAGEYALGSVSGRAGAYLMYLDIGAAAESNQITIVTEKVTKDAFSYQYPSGIDFAAIPLADDDYTYVATNGGDIGTVIIPNGVYGTFSFALSGMILTCGPPSGGAITQSTFIGDGASLLCSTSPESTELEAVPVSHTNVVIDSVTTYTYDPFNEVLYTDLETSTTTTVNGVAQTPVDRIYDTIEQSVPEADYTLHKIGLMPGDSDVAFFELYYYCSSAATVDIACTYTGLYDEEHDTYSYYYVIQVVSDEDITMHIASVLEKPGFDFNITVRRVNSAKTAYEDITDFGEQNTCQIYAGSISGS